MSLQLDSVLNVNLYLGDECMLSTSHDSRASIEVIVIAVLHPYTTLALTKSTRVSTTGWVERFVKTFFNFTKTDGDVAQQNNQ